MVGGWVAQNVWLAGQAGGGAPWRRRGAGAGLLGCRLRLSGDLPLPAAPRGPVRLHQPPAAGRGPTHALAPSRPPRRPPPPAGTHPARCREILRNSPTALRVLKSALNAAEDGQAGIQQLGGDATLLFYQSQEGNEVRGLYAGRARGQHGGPAGCVGVHA